MDEARLSDFLARRSRERREREKAANSGRLSMSARTGAKRRSSKTTPPMDWLRSLTCRLVYGEPTPDGIRPSNTKDQLRSRWNLGWHIAKLANYQFADHFAGRATYYFFGNGDPEADHTLVMIDIDVGKSLGLGSPAGAVAFANHLKTRWPNLYFEPSTGGEGVHAYLVVEKHGLGAGDVNALLKRLQDWLRAEHRRVGADIELVEVKGTCPVIDFQFGEMVGVRYGSFAKLPRDAARFAEWQATTVITAADLRGDTFDVKEPADVALARPAGGRKRASKPVAGSVSDRLISDKELAALPALAALARRLTGGKPLKTGRFAVTDEDFAIALLLLRFFHANPNPDGSIPKKRAEALWTALYDAGDVHRAWNNRRWKVIRDSLSASGHIHWTDHRYEYGHEVDGRYVPGTACRFTITESFAAELELAVAGAGTVSSTPGGASFGDTPTRHLAVRRGTGRFLTPTLFPFRAERERTFWTRAFGAGGYPCAA